MTNQENRALGPSQDHYCYQLITYTVYGVADTHTHSLTYTHIHTMSPTNTNTESKRKKISVVSIAVSLLCLERCSALSLPPPHPCLTPLTPRSRSNSLPKLGQRAGHITNKPWFCYTDDIKVICRTLVFIFYSFC